ncbi:MAG: hypothetical protein C0618_04780 [Desulfuromonas sp.]|nr:MAG: hypothetical protein C0618_04780 [Desulfuromonas sp.]
MVDSIRIEWLTDMDSVDAIAHRWKQLAAVTAKRTLFSCYEWVSVWYRHYGAYYGYPLVGVASDNARVVAIFPLVFRQATFGKIPVRLAEFAGFNAEAGELLVAPGYDAVVGALVSSLLEQNFVDIVALNGVEKVHPLQSALNPNNSKGWYKIERQQDCYAVVDLKGGFEGYCQSLKSKLRNNLKRQRKKIETVGAWRVETCGRDASCAEHLSVLDRVFAIYDRSWKAASGGVLSDLHRDYYRELISQFAQQNMADTALLQIDGADVAFIVCLVEGNVYYDVKVSYDENFAALSPGIFLMHNYLQYVAGQGGVSVVSHGNRAYKKNWATAFVPRERVYLFRNNLKGRLANFSKFRLERYLPV